VTDSVHKQREWTQCLRQSSYLPSARIDGIHWNGSDRSSSRRLNLELRYETITCSYKDGNIIHKDTWNERS